MTNLKVLKDVYKNAQKVADEAKADVWVAVLEQWVENNGGSYNNGVFSAYLPSIELEKLEKGIARFHICEDPEYDWRKITVAEFSVEEDIFYIVGLSDTWTDIITD